MSVLVWITENTWAACVDAARAIAPPDAEITLLAVTDTGPADAAQGAFGGLLGRHGPDPAERLSLLAAEDADHLLAAAAARLGGAASQARRHGRAEHEVVAAARGAGLLIVAREGHGTGPKSLGKAVRFVVDHAPCAVLLVWP
jgi:nucleotide-binding universal stress UspA family protein